MNRAELTAVVDIVKAAWNRDSWKEDESKTVRAWWRYLQDLDFNQVLETIDIFVTRGGAFPPTVGEIRRATIDRTDPSERPTVGEAWKQVSERIRAVEAGLDWPEIHPLVSQALRHAGFDGRGKVDERTFKASWDAITIEEDDGRYRVQDPEPFGEGK